MAKKIGAAIISIYKSVFILEFQRRSNFFIIIVQEKHFFNDVQ